MLTVMLLMLILLIGMTGVGVMTNKQIMSGYCASKRDIGLNLSFGGARCFCCPAGHRVWALIDTKT